MKKSISGHRRSSPLTPRSNVSYIRLTFYPLNKMQRLRMLKINIRRRYCNRKQPKKNQIRLQKSNVKPIIDPRMDAKIKEYMHNMELSARRPIRQNIAAFMEEGCRTAIVDWLAQIAEQHKLSSEAFHLSVSCIDRFLTTNAVSDDIYGPVHLATACFLIAGKYVHLHRPTINDLSRRSEYTLTKQELMQLEAQVLKALNYEVGYPTAYSFLSRLTNVAQEDFETLSLEFQPLCYYLAELSLLECGCIEFLPSLVAASVVFLARFTLNPSSHPWNLCLEQISGYKPSHLQECVGLLHDMQLGKQYDFRFAIREKYGRPKFKSVSKLQSPSEIPICFFDDVNG